jgi:hypothetical protein
MNETEFRHRLFDLAKNAPSGSSAPPALLRRARRRVVLTIASSVAIAVLVVGMGIAGVRALQTAPTPADPPTPTPIPGSLGSLAYEADGDIFGPTGTVRTRSGSRTAVPPTVAPGAARPNMGRRDRSGRPTDGISPLGMEAVRSSRPS